MQLDVVNSEGPADKPIAETTNPSKICQLRRGWSRKKNVYYVKLSSLSKRSANAKRTDGGEKIDELNWGSTNQ